MPRIKRPTATGDARLVALLGDDRFRRLWLAGGIAGTLRWLETLAVGVYVFQVTRSPSLVALMTFVRMVPMLVVGLPAGAIAERFDRKALLVGGLAVLSAVSAVLALLTHTGNLALWHIGLGAFIAGTFWTTEFPVRRIMAGEIVGPSRLAGAMGLESATGNATRMLGPLIGGLLLDLVGLAGAYLISALCHGLAALVVAPMTYRPEVVRAAPSRMLARVAEGLAYAWRVRVVLATLLVTVIVNLFGFAYISMVPVIGEGTLGLSAFWTGLLMSSEGFGALLGALAVGTWAATRDYGAIYVGFSFLFLVMVVLFALSRSFPLSLAALFLSGIGISGFAVMQSTIMFTIAPAEMRSRLMGALTVCIGAGPLGMLHVGYLAEWFGAPGAVAIIAGEGLIALSALAWAYPELCRRRPLPRPERRAEATPGPATPRQSPDA